MKRTISMTCILMMILVLAVGFAYGKGKPDKPPKPGDPPDDPPETSEILPWGADRIDADEVWDSDHDMVVDDGANTGQGIKIAVLDTGISPHEDFTIAGGASFVGADYNDNHGHGINIAGVLAALDNDLGVIGAVPGVELYAVKWREQLSFLPDGPLGDPASYSYPDLYAAMQWCIDNQMQVINMSFGLWTPKLENGVPVVLPNGEYDKDNPLHDPVFYNLIVQAHAAGIVMVAAAGNDYGRTIGIWDPANPPPEWDPTEGCWEDQSWDYMFPASYPEVIAVSATGFRTGGKKSDRGDYFTSFSNVGPAVELTAPGVSVETTVEGGYGFIGGTSAACPHVAATAALVLKQFGATIPASGLPAQVRTILTGTAEWVDRLTWEQQGSGMVDAQAAVGLASGAPPLHMLSPRGKLSVTWGALKNR